MHWMGPHIERLRVRRGLSRSSLAKRLGVSSQTVFNVERKQEYNLTTDMLRRLETALGVEFEVTIKEATMPNPTVVIGSDEMILHIRKREPASSLDNDKLGAAIASWFRQRGVQNPIRTKVPSMWGTEGSFVGADQLPKTAAQWEFDRALLPELYTFLETL